jgi:hypothetical protein
MSQPLNSRKFATCGNVKKGLFRGPDKQKEK